MDAIGLVGLTFRSQGASAVARLTVAREARAETVEKLAAALGVAELVYLATCNRVEILYRERDGRRAADRRRDVFRVLTGQEPQPGEAEHLLRGWQGEGAVEHLFVVAAGLDSAQLGEREIQGQLRDALNTARSASFGCARSDSRDVNDGNDVNGGSRGPGSGLLGRLVEEATTAELFARPSHPYTKGLLASVPRITGAVTRLTPIAGTVPAPTAWPAGCRFHPRCPAALPRCATDDPPALPVGDAHRMRCWLAEGRPA